MVDLEIGADDEGKCTGRVLECVGVCPACRGRDTGRSGGVICVCGTTGRALCGVLGVGDGVGPFEGGRGAAGASSVCDKGVVASGAAGRGAGLASRLDALALAGAAVPPRWPIWVTGNEPLFPGVITLDDASGELVRPCWLRVNVRGGSACAVPGAGDAIWGDPAGVTFPVEGVRVRNTVPVAGVAGLARAVSRCAGRRGECVYGRPPDIPEGPTCLNVDWDGRGRGGAYEAVDVDGCGSCSCSGVGGTTMMGDGSAELGFDTGDGGEVRICIVDWS